MSYDDRPSRREIEREEAEDLIAWAGEHSPDLLPEDGSDPDEWPSCFDAIRAAKFQAERVPFTPDPRFADMEEPF